MSIVICYGPTGRCQRTAPCPLACDLRVSYDPPQHDPIVGHKTFVNPDGLTYRHEPLRESEARALLASAEASQAKRAADMPTEEDAARAMHQAYLRLKELGWRETMYGPTNVQVRLIEPGSSGIHQGSRWEPWPEKTWWIDNDWPSNPCLFKPLPEDTK